MDFNDFEKLITEYFGYRLSFYTVNHDTKTVKCILYESFVVELSIGDRYGVFGASIWLGGLERSMRSILGEKICLNSDAESIKRSLGIIDNYCRLRLPDKFLDAFEKAYGN